MHFFGEFFTQGDSNFAFRISVREYQANEIIGKLGNSRKFAEHSLHKRIR